MGGKRRREDTGQEAERVRADAEETRKRRQASGCSKEGGATEEQAVDVEMVVVGQEDGDEAAAGGRSEEAGAREEVAPVPQRRHPARWLAALRQLHPRDRHPRSSP